MKRDYVCMYIDVKKLIQYRRMLNYHLSQKFKIIKNDEFNYLINIFNTLLHVQTQTLIK
jgi:hypothetical protein